MLSRVDSIVVPIWESYFCLPLAANLVTLAVLYGLEDSRQSTKLAVILPKLRYGPTKTRGNIQRGHYSSTINLPFIRP